ncbi:hypothetical protein SAMD00019534_032900 [Acytostelium subglobosum LB1]|uniref:hypothetical protein n=1 Tax=Acytostelium subglobosum LB1 TaxID=1410327 RepID=UPI000644837B|nr:hypothetical protein SAMD00019534_032900 [Acytostelium subglobosum LB1]GAM20115.1 hypothetical protein SAMD00019534_032900 [Acytostelium subglobosum LB1]|eukprot:XP_012756877.1 hypothetical protein SAMD00019534_032900 [Acytostelium subglobosum LB1]
MLALKKYDQLSITSRLDRLWYKLQHLASTYQVLDTSNRYVVNQFMQLHEQLVVEEHKVTSPLIREMDLTHATILEIVKELADIDNIVKVSSNGAGSEIMCAPRNGGEVVVGMDRDQLAQSIKECNNIETFMEMAFPSTEESEPCSDHELLTIVQQALKQMDVLSYPDTHQFRIKTDCPKLGDIKRQIQSCFKIIDSHEFHNSTFSFGQHACSLFNPATQCAIVLKDGFKPRTGILTAMISARESLYVFGGMESPGTYSRFTLADHQWTNDNPMSGIESGYGISACFDGDKHIYLVGGMHPNDSYMNRVDCFDIETQKFRHIGQLPVSLGSAHTFFHDGKVYVVGGFYSTNNQHGMILSFNINTLVCEVIVNGLDLGSNVISCCFDGDSNVYIYTNCFFRVSLVNKLRNNLSPVTVSRSNGYHQESQVLTGPNLIFYDKEYGILFLRGKGNNFQYSVTDNKWVALSDHYRNELNDYEAVRLIRD